MLFVACKKISAFEQNTTNSFQSKTKRLMERFHDLDRNTETFGLPTTAMPMHAIIIRRGVTV